MDLLFDNMKQGIDYIGVNCVFLCHDGNGKILLHKRSKACRDEQGTWDCGGGAVEHGETFEKAVRRELQEEYRVSPKEIHYFGTRDLIRKLPDGQISHWILNLHLVLVDPQAVEIGEPEKMEAIGWFALDDLPSPLHSALLEDLALAKKFFYV